jgi:enoyl-[acyl-carrier-protein] reductase (NADH)
MQSSPAIPRPPRNCFRLSIRNSAKKIANEAAGHAVQPTALVLDDIGWATLFLASPTAKFIGGVVLPVDGGAAIGF